MDTPRLARAVRVPRWKLRRWLPAVLLTGLGGAAAVAQPPAQPAPPAKAAPATKPERTFTYKFDRASWDSVFGWLSRETGLVLVSTAKPTSTASIEFKDKTLTQVIDLINEALAAEKFILVRQTQSYQILPADIKLPPELVTPITTDQLPKYGDSEVVRVVVPLRTVLPETVVNSMKPFKSNFGELAAFGNNSIVVQDKAANVRSIIDNLKVIESGGDKGDSLTHQCKHQSASKVADTLRGLLSDQDTQVSTPAFAPGAVPGTPGAPGFVPPGGFPQQQFNPRGGFAGAAGTRFKTVNIAILEETNSVFITGPADKLAAAERFLKDIDVPTPGTAGRERIPGGTPTVQTYSVPPGTAESLQKILNDRYKSSAITRITAVGTSQLLVYALPQEHFDIAAQLKGTSDQGPATRTEFIPLNSLDPTTTAKSLERTFGGTKDAPVVEGKTDTAQPGVLVTGTPQQIEQAKAVLKALGETPVGGGLGQTGNLRIIGVEKGNAALLAEALAEMMRKMGKNKVEVTAPGSAPPAPLPAPKPAAPPANPGEKRSALPGRGDGTELVRLQISDPQAKPPAAPAAPPAPADKKPVTITVTPGNKLIITSDDPEALELVTTLANLLKSERGADDRYEVIRLKNASAKDAARVINEVFNGPPQPAAPQVPAPGGRGGGFNPLGFLQQFAGGGAAAPTNPAAGRVRVVAEETSNSLIVVKASELDLLQIKALLAKAIDNSEGPVGGTLQTWYIALKSARAEDVSDRIREVFANQTGASARRSAVFSPFPVPGAQAPPQTVALTVSADEASNSVIVNCTEALYKEVKALCDTLDKGAKETARVVRIVPTPGVSPTQVQQAIDALLGREPTTTTNTGFRPGGGFSPFGGRGFSGGFSPSGGGNRGGGSGGNRGSGRGGTRGGRSQRSADDQEGRRPFDYAGTDAPSALIFDPQADDAGDEPSNAGRPDPLVRQAQATQPQVPTLPTPVPSADVTVQPLEELGAVVITAQNAADIEEVLKFVEYLQRVAADAQIELKLVPLSVGDATQITNSLVQIFSRVQTGPGSTAIVAGQAQRTPFGGFGFPFGGFGGQQQQQQGQTAGSLVLVALPRFNSILVAAPKSALPGVEAQIKALDREVAPSLRPQAYPLKKASAQIVNQVLQTFLGQRYPGETLSTTQTRTFADIPSNTVYVQASPADQREIAEIITYLDSRTSQAVNEVKVFRLRNAFADELAQVLNQALVTSIVNPSLGANAGTIGAGTTGAVGTGAAPGAIGQGAIGGFAQAGQAQLGALGGVGGRTGGQQLGQAFGGGGAFGGAGGQFGAAGGATGALTGQTAGLTTKTTALRFVAKNGLPVESGLLEDVHITPNGRINALVVAAPEKTMRLLEALIAELDTVAAAQAFVNVFPLKRADAVTTQQLLTALFRSAAAGAGGAAGGAGGANQQFGGPAAATQGGFGATGGVTRPLLTLTGAPADGANLIDLRITADPRTNTVIVAGSRADLDTISAIIARLEDAPALTLRQEVYKLRNAAAADVANAVNTFISGKINFVNAQFSAANANPVSLAALRQSFVVTPEPVSNTLSIAAPPELFDEIANLILKIDMAPPQVAVQVLIAEVQLDKRDEFGIEIGLQSPIIFARGTGVGTPGTPGFNFNTTNTALPNANLFKQQSVGFQGLGNLGVGRAGANGVGGLVFSAASDTVNVLVRALETQGRTDILSRPQLTLTDNQTGFFQVGQQFPRLDATVLTGVGNAQQSITYVDIGIVLRVTPRISPDGRVLMRVEPQISAPNPIPINLGTAGVATAFDIQTVQTTVQVADGETVVLGGLLRRADVKTENKIPWLGDLPWVGAAFRYRQQEQQRRELIFIVTPHIIRSSEDFARIALQESAKMSWNFADVMGLHGHGGDVLNGGRVPYCPPAGPSPATTLTAPPTVFGDANMSGPAVVPPPAPAVGVPVAATPIVPVPPPSGSGWVMPQAMPAVPPVVAPPVVAPAAPLPGGVAPGFPPQQSSGRPSVFAPPGTPAVVPAAAPQPVAKEGQPWNVFSR